MLSCQLRCHRFTYICAVHPRFQGIKLKLWQLKSVGVRLSSHLFLGQEEEEVWTLFPSCDKKLGHLALRHEKRLPPLFNISHFSFTTLLLRYIHTTSYRGVNLNRSAIFIVQSLSDFFFIHPYLHFRTLFIESKHLFYLYQPKINSPHSEKTKEEDVKDGDSSVINYWKLDDQLKE